MLTPSESELATSDRGEPLSEAEGFTRDAEGDTLAGMMFIDECWFADAHLMVRNPEMDKRAWSYRDGLIEF